MHPRQMRETVIPVLPSFEYCMISPFAFGLDPNSDAGLMRVKPRDEGDEFVNTGCRGHPAQGSLKPTAGFKLDEVIYLARVRAVEASRPPDVAGEHRNRDHECSSPAPALIRRRRSAPRQKSR